MRQRKPDWEWLATVAIFCVILIILISICVKAILPEREPMYETIPPATVAAADATTAETVPAETEIPDEEHIWSDTELEYMAITIYAEAGGDACSDETRLMVGQVVLNRVRDARWPNTIEKVLMQPHQYGTNWKTGIRWPKRASKNTEAAAVQRAYNIAKRVLNGEGLSVCPQEVVYQSNSKQGKGVFAYQDGLYFCY